MMSAGFQGQGGIFALLNALKWKGDLASRPRVWRLFQGLAVAGVAFMTADAMLTSSVSVTSAVEGLGLALPAFNGLTSPRAFRSTNAIAATVLCGVFALQAAGSGRIGVLYAPIMLTWLVFIAVVGAYNISLHPSVLSAWSPAVLWRFWTTGNYKGVASWRSLGGIVMCLTGSEALYADMGHFGRGPIALAWFTAVLPALVMQYTGQSAYLLRNMDVLLPDPAHGAACAAAWHAGAACSGAAAGAECCARYVAAQDLTANSFWHALPGARAYRAMLAVATLASIVGSQSVITGVFTIFSQAAGLGLFPSVEVVQTSSEQEGQVFCPGINRAMCVCVLIVVGAFQHASNLTAVFGACVACAFLCDSVLRLGVAYYVQGWRPLVVALIAAPLLLMDGALASANVAKYFTAGSVLLGEGDPLGRTSWIAFIPLILVVLIAGVMFVWMWGRRTLLLDAAKRTSALMILGSELRKSPSALDVEEALDAVRSPAAAPGPPPTAICSPADVNVSLPSPAAPSAAIPAAAALDERPAQEAKGEMQRVRSFQTAFKRAGVPMVGALGDQDTYLALGDALLQLARGGALVRTPCIAVYLSPSASLLDTEPLPVLPAPPVDPPHAERQAGLHAAAHATERHAAQRHAAERHAAEHQPLERPLELPHALLHAVAEGALPRVTIVLAVDFTPRDAFLTPDSRLRVRRLRTTADAEAEQLPGVFHVTISYGWAERPRSRGELLQILASLGAAAAEPGAQCPELVALQHIACKLPGAGACASPADCLPSRFVVTRDALCAAEGATVSLRLAMGLFNAISANFCTAAELYKLPPAAVTEVSPPVVLAEKAERAAWRDQAVKNARTTAVGLRIRRPKNSSV